MEADGTPEDRLEAALERIAKFVETRGIASAAPPPQGQVATEIADRLDRIIDTLREALGK